MKFPKTYTATLSHSTKHIRLLMYIISFILIPNNNIHYYVWYILLSKYFIASGKLILNLNVQLAQLLTNYVMLPYWELFLNVILITTVNRCSLSELSQRRQKVMNLLLDYNKIINMQPSSHLVTGCLTSALYSKTHFICCFFVCVKKQASIQLLTRCLYNKVTYHISV